MGSVISEIECPECHYENATEDLYYRTGETYIFCERCGFYLEWTMKKEDKESNKIPKDCEFVEKKGGGFGCAKIMFNEGGQITSLKNKEHLIEFEKSIKEGISKGEIKNGYEKTPTEVYYTFKKDNKWYIKDIIKGIIYPFERLNVIERL